MVISDRACVHPHGARVSEENARDNWVGTEDFLFSFLLKLSLAYFNFAFVFGDGFGVGSNGF